MNIQRIIAGVALAAIIGAVASAQPSDCQPSHTQSLDTIGCLSIELAYGQTLTRPLPTEVTTFVVDPDRVASLPDLPQVGMVVKKLAAQ